MTCQPVGGFCRRVGDAMDEMRWQDGSGGREGGMEWDVQPSTVDDDDDGRRG